MPTGARPNYSFEVCDALLKSATENIKRRIHEHQESADAQTAHQNEEQKFQREWSEKVFIENQRSEEDRGRRDDRSHSTQHSIKKATWIAAIGACFYGAVATYQAYEMRRSTEAADRSAKAAECASNTATAQFNLTLQQMKYTEKARVFMNGSFKYSKDGLESIRFQFVNNGHEKATKLNGTLHLSERSVNTRRIIKDYGALPIATSYPLDAISDPVPLQYGNLDSRYLSQTWTLNIPAAKMARIWDTRDFFEVDMRLNFFDGFDDTTPTLSFCSMTYWETRWIGDGPNNQVFFPCEGFDPMLNEIKRNGEVEKKYHETWPNMLKK